MNRGKDKDQVKGQSQQDQFKDRKQRIKAKRRDMFQTAPISRNIFQSSNNETDYTNQKIKPKETKAQVITNPVVEQQDVNRKKQEQRINIVNVIQIANQGSSGFIFQASSQSDNQVPQSNKQKQKDEIQKASHGANESEKANDDKEDIDVNLNNKYDFKWSDDEDSENAQKSSTKIIFQQCGSEDNEDQSNKQIKKVGVRSKNTIQLFGQKIQVDIQFQQNQQKTDSNKMEKKQQGDDPEEPKIQKPKQLLKAYSMMPNNTFAKMKLVRNKAGQGGKTFYLYLQSNLRFIMSAKHTSSQTYLLSEHHQIAQQNNQYYLGKIKTSFFGNQLNLFSKGLNPQKAKSKNTYPRQVLCTVVTHSQQIMDDVKPRDFTAYVLKQQCSYYKDLQGVKMYEQQVPLSKLYEEYNVNRDKIYVYQNRKSKWNQKQKMHSLNMKGRAKLPSIKNYILQSPLENGRQIMLFGKMNENQFSFDIHYPISPIIGLAIALSSFSHKSW